MSEQELFNGLIATYRELNMKVRSLPEERLSLGRGRNTVRHVIVDMRDDELRFSQALKERLTGVPMTNIFGADADAEMPEVPSPDETTVYVADTQLGRLWGFDVAEPGKLAPGPGFAPGHVICNLPGSQLLV